MPNSYVLLTYKSTAIKPNNLIFEAYPFGMVMPGRSYSNGAYRFGFNGKAADAETNDYDYGFRIYNSRIGRFLSVDPITSSYPWYSPYHFAGNQPIWAIDLDGLEEYIVITWWDKHYNSYRTLIQCINPEGPLKVTYKIRKIINQKSDENVDQIGDKNSKHYNSKRFVDQTLEIRLGADYENKDDVWKDASYKSRADNALKDRRKNKNEGSNWFNDGTSSTKFLNIHVWKWVWAPVAWYLNPSDREDFLNPDNALLKLKLRGAIHISKVDKKNELFIWVTNETDRAKFQERYNQLGFKKVTVTIKAVNEEFDRGDGILSKLSSEGAVLINNKINKFENKKVKPKK